jgi:hypothetical protein
MEYRIVSPSIIEVSRAVITSGAFFTESVLETGVAAV